MPRPSTQEFLEIKQIRNGVIVLKNNALRAVLMVSSLNFALKTAEEQEAILYQFQNFLNSLDFTCQIVASSRRLNITGYLDKLKELEEKEENELLKLQIKEYHSFIEGLMTGGNVVQKNFYVVVPFTIFEQKGPNKRKLRVFSELTEKDFQRAKSQLIQRVEFVALGLKRCGLQAIPLTTSELIELFWSLYHPLEAERGYYPEIPPELSL
ncbi:MAG TPA: hypothetical protein ENL33_00430 [Candidatus Parcubacteria bacterium]|nr:hypothetical protein [Candidatus Parcubacteria bacterium]